MKDTGVPALGAVPEHWQVRRLASLGRLFKGNGGSKEDDCAEGVPCVRYGDLYTTHTFHITRSRGFIPHEKVSEYTPIRYGDVLFAASGETIDEIGKSAVNLIESAACCGGDVVVFRPQFEVNARFLGYATDCRPAAVQKARMGRGITVKHIYDSELRNLVVALPPLDEQAAIVRFLDHADRRIRQYIRAKKKLIVLLNEQKQAIIARAVTRGLNPDVRLRSSGIEWLGEVPEHWNIVRLKYAASSIVDCLHATPAYSDAGEYPAIRTADISPGIVRLNSARRVSEEVYRRWTQRLEPAAGDILYSREGERYGIAACVPIGARLCISQRMMVFRLRPEHNPQFIMWLLNTPFVLAQATQDVIGATAPHVNISTIRNFVLAIPCGDEQTAIARYIDDATSGFAKTIETAQRQIVLVREFSTRLVADVVTGKLDVRDAVKDLPQEVEEADFAEPQVGAVSEDVEDLSEPVPEEAEA